jgi:uncharacterized membrane protein
MPVGAVVMAAVLGGSGLLHLARPKLYEPLVPRWMPARRELVLVSGVAELVCAAGLAARRPWAPVASSALLLVVWPGNWQMAFDVQRDPAAHPMVKAAVWARLPVQLPMIRAVLGARHRPGHASG